MKRFLLSRPVGIGMRGVILLAMLLMSLGYSGTEVVYAAPPVNDDFDAAKTIGGIEYHDTADTREATPTESIPNVDDPTNFSCDGIPQIGGFASVWYKYTPPEMQSLSLNTFGSNYDTFVAVWTGSRGSLNLVACNDQTFEGNQSELSFVANGGTTYYIEIAHFDDGEPGGFNGGDLVFNAFITNTTVTFGETFNTSYYIPETSTLSKNFLSLNAGPVEIFNVASNQIVTSKRILYAFKGKITSYSEMLGLPENQLNRVLWLPWYNNKTMSSALRIANVSGSPTSVRIRIGGVDTTDSPFTINPGESVVKSYPGIDRGPVKIISTPGLIVASQQILYTVNGVRTSLSEIMAMPHSKLSRVSWFPWYNNKTMSSQIQVANAGKTTATIRVTIGGKPMKGSPFTLGSGKSRRLNYPGIQGGPVKITSTVNVLASQRFTYKVNKVPVSYSEMMGLPSAQVSTTYWLPTYTHNSSLNTQLQIANLGSSAAMVHVYMRGVELTGSPFKVARGTSRSLTFAGINKGPVRIQSNVKILVSERVIYKFKGVITSYSEMMALPNGLMDDRYWMPWYNNVSMNSQLRLGMP